MLRKSTSNYSFGIIPGEKREFGSCDMEIEGQKAEPPPEKRAVLPEHIFTWTEPTLDMVLLVKRTGNYSRHGTRKILLTTGNMKTVRELSIFRGMRTHL